MVKVASKHGGDEAAEDDLGAAIKEQSVSDSPTCPRRLEKTTKANCARKSKDAVVVPMIQQYKHSPESGQREPEQKHKFKRKVKREPVDDVEDVFQDREECKDDPVLQAVSFVFLG